MRIALDTNILAYAEGVNGRDMRDATLRVMGQLLPHEIIIPAQVLGELLTVLRRKARRSANEAKQSMLTWSDAYRIAPTTSEVLFSAADLSADHGLPVWDAVIMSAASHAQCRLLLSEDLQDGFTWRGTTVVSPYSERPGPLFSALLNPAI